MDENVSPNEVYTVIGRLYVQAYKLNRNLEEMNLRCQHLILENENLKATVNAGKAPPIPQRVLDLMDKQVNQDVPLTPKAKTSG